MSGFTSHFPQKNNAFCSTKHNLGGRTVKKVVIFKNISQSTNIICSLSSAQTQLQAPLRTAVLWATQLKEIKTHSPVVFSSLGFSIGSVWLYKSILRKKTQSHDKSQEKYYIYQPSIHHFYSLSFQFIHVQYPQLSSSSFSKYFPLSQCGPVKRAGRARVNQREPIIAWSRVKEEVNYHWQVLSGEKKKKKQHKV